MITESPTLLRGFARNTFFNVSGLLWTMLLTFLSTPYIIGGLGYEGYGIFGIITLLTGYAGLFNSPMANGTVRFLAEAYGRKDWGTFRPTAIIGLVLSSGLALVAAIVIMVAAQPLTALFGISTTLQNEAIFAFRLAALSYLSGSIYSALEALPVAIRRFEIVNGVRIVSGTLKIGGILLAIRWGYGLTGTVAAQILANVVAGFCLFLISWVHLPCSPSAVTEHNRTFVRQLFSFSFVLFMQQTLFTIGLQIDRSLIAFLLGPATLTFYQVPAQISDRIPILMASITAALYPLSAEAVSTDQIVELQQLYLHSLKALIWLSACIATLIIVSANELLRLWVGSDIANRSWLVLVILTVAAAWRTPSTVAYQVYNGLGRADIGLQVALFTIGGYVTFIALLTPLYGILGAAVGYLLVTVPVVVYADLLTQQRLLQQRQWRLSLLLYAKPWLVGGLLAVSLALLPATAGIMQLVGNSLAVMGSFVIGMWYLDREFLQTLWQRLTRQTPLLETP